MADVGGGLGPFLSTWLAQINGWGPSRIGWVIAAGSLVGAFLASPAGSLVDRLAKPRLMLAIGAGCVLLGTLALMPARAFFLVLIAQIVVAGGGALGGPSISGLTLSIVGKNGYPRQQGRNEAANHAGNVAAAGIIALLSWQIGPYAAVAVLVLMALASLVTLGVMDPKSISGERMRGRKKREKGEKRGATRALARDHRLWRVLGVVGLFQLGNSAMLPLLGQRIVHEGSNDVTAWMSAGVITASLTMIPVALLAGSSADRYGRRWAVIGALVVVILRCALAMFATGRLWLIPIEILDGIAAATFSVCAPLAVADITYGGGRTQTAMGAMTTVQAGFAALASILWGYAVDIIGYAAAFGAMAIFPAIGVALLLKIVLENPQEAEPKAAAMSAAA